MLPTAHLVKAFGLLLKSPGSSSVLNKVFIFDRVAAEVVNGSSLPLHRLKLRQELSDPELRNDVAEIHFSIKLALSDRYLLIELFLALEPGPALWVGSVPLLNFAAAQNA